MPSLRTLALLTVALGLILVAPAAGGAVQNSGPPAGAEGVPPPPAIPSIVKTRIVRAEAALNRAAAYTNANQLSKVPAALYAARAQGTYAWNAAKYVIKSAPAVPPEEDAVPDGTEAGSAYAGPEDTAFAVLSLQHEIVSTVVGLMTQVDSKNAVLRKSWVDAISSSQATRNAAVAYVHTLAPPPVEDGVGADGPVEGGVWETVMPNVVPLVNDEIKDINGRMKMTGFAGTLRTSLLNSRTRAVKTRTLVNRYWPPEPVED